MPLIQPQTGLLGGSQERHLTPHSSWPLLLVWADDTGTPVTKIELLPSYSTATLIGEPTEVEDPWDLPALQNTGIKWSGKN